MALRYHTPATSFVIRPAIFADLPALEWEGEYAHYRMMFRHTFEEMQHGHKLMLLAVEGEHKMMVGQVFIQFHSAEKHFADGKRRGYVYALRVKPTWRGHGLGTRLMLAAEAELKQRGFAEASISVAKTNKRACQLYERLGYHIFMEDPGEWTFVDEQGIERRMIEPSWVLEKRW